MSHTQHFRAWWFAVTCQVQVCFLRSFMDDVVMQVILLVQPRALTGPYLSAQVPWRHMTEQSGPLFTAQETVPLNRSLSSVCVQAYIHAYMSGRISCVYCMCLCVCSWPLSKLWSPSWLLLQLSISVFRVACNNTLLYFWTCKVLDVLYALYKLKCCRFNI